MVGLWPDLVLAACLVLAPVDAGVGLRDTFGRRQGVPKRLDDAAGGAYSAWGADRALATHRRHKQRVLASESAGQARRTARNPDDGCSRPEALKQWRLWPQPMRILRCGHQRALLQAGAAALEPVVEAEADLARGLDNATLQRRLERARAAVIAYRDAVGGHLFQSPHRAGQ